MTSPPARTLNRPRTAHASRGERGPNPRIHSKSSSHSRNPSVTPIPSAAGQYTLKRRPQPPWVMHKPVISSASSTSSQETKDRRSTSTTRSCASAPVTPLKSTIRLDFSDSEEYFPRGASSSSHQPSSTLLRPPTHTDNEGEPKRGRKRSVKDHSSRRILFNSDLRNSISNTRPIPPPVMILDTPRYLSNVESVRSPADTERTATVFTAEPEEILTPDDITASQVRKRASWKSKLFSKPRAAATDQTTVDAEISPAASTPNTTTFSSAKEKENSFLRLFGTNKRQASVSEQSIAAAVNDTEVVDPKKKSALRKFGKIASRKSAAADAPSPKDARSPLPRLSTLSDTHLPSPTSPCSGKLNLKHAATFGPDAPSPSTAQPPMPAPSKQQHPKEARNGSGHSGMHTFLHPIQACQARLYNVHGIGSGPSTLDLLMPTPIPKGGVRRTDPYAELGIARMPAVNVIAARRASAPSSVPEGTKGA